MDYLSETREDTTNETAIKTRSGFIVIFIHNCVWFFAKAQMITRWNHNDIPKGHQQCWTFKSHKETFTTWTKETGRSNTLSFYMDKPLENSGFQIICWTTKKHRNPEVNSGKAGFSSTQVINFCLVFPDSLSLIPFCSSSLLLWVPSAPAGTIFPSSTWFLFSCCCISKAWQSSWVAPSPPVSQISASVKLPLPSSHWKDRETSERISLASVSRTNREWISCTPTCLHSSHHLRTFPISFNYDNQLQFYGRPSRCSA